MVYQTEIQLCTHHFSLIIEVYGIDNISNNTMGNESDNYSEVFQLYAILNSELVTFQDNESDGQCV